MESRGAAQILLVLVLCVSTGSFCYTIGRQAGEQDSREVQERQLREMRLASTLEAQGEGDVYAADLYTGDQDYEDDAEVDYVELDESGEPIPYLDPAETEPAEADHAAE